MPEGEVDEFEKNFQGINSCYELEDDQKINMPFINLNNSNYLKMIKKDCPEP